MTLSGFEVEVGPITLEFGDNVELLFSCPEQLKRWPCQSLIQSRQYIYFWYTKSDLPLTHLPTLTTNQGGRSWGSAGAALPERSGSSTKGRTSNIRYFVAKPSIVAIYALFERLSQGFQLKPSCSHRACFLRAFNKSNPSFVEFSAKAILLS